MISLYFFRDNPPGPSCTSAVQELSRLSQNTSVEMISPLQDWKWNNMELVSKFQELAILRSRLDAVACTSCSQFEDHVSFTRTELQSFKISLKESRKNLESEFGERPINLLLTVQTVETNLRCHGG